jgi:hypothetical protein
MHVLSTELTLNSYYEDANVLELKNDLTAGRDAYVAAKALWRAANDPANVGYDVVTTTISYTRVYASKGDSLSDILRLYEIVFLD